MADPIKEAQGLLLAELKQSKADRDEDQVKELKEFLMLTQATGAQAPRMEGAAGIRQNVQHRLAKNLFAPFARADFPASAQPQELFLMLRRQPTCLVPCGPEDGSQIASAWPVGLHAGAMPPLFTESTQESGGDVFKFFYRALTLDWPTFARTEMEFVDAWNGIGYSLPLCLRNWRSYPISMGRNRVDASITLDDQKRDLLIFCNNVLVVGGEDKSSASDLKVAISECLSKHKTVSRLTYGDLSYVLLVATAGHKMQIHAMPIDAPDRMCPITDEIELNSVKGRCDCLLCWINVSRWIATILEEKMLPPPPIAELNTPVTRKCPYPGGESGTIEFGMRGVVKVLHVPQQQMEILVGVYCALKAARLKGALMCSCCSRMEVDGDEVDLAAPRRSARLSPQPKPHPDKWHVVRLQLRPLGAMWLPPQLPGLCELMRDLLQTLQAVHGEGIVHRDVREANIVRADCWLLIDFELAAPIGTATFWLTGDQPEAARQGEGWTPAMDLYQLGHMLSRLLGANSSKCAPAWGFAHQLTNMEFASAERALSAMPAPTLWQ